ncbi:MAG: TonB family protein [bacterium]|nr:TonB family protein [bacterium]
MERLTLTPFGVSLLGHACFLALIWAVAHWSPLPPEPLLDATLVFEKAGGGLPALESPKPVPAPVAPPSPPEPEKAPEAIRSAEPQKKTKPTPAQVEPKPIEAEKKPVEAPPVRPQPPAETAGNAEAGGSGLLSTRLSSMSYKSLLRQKVEGRWKAPRIEREYQILFMVTIKPDGRIDQLELRESSGLDLLDQAAKKAILASAPFPAPPQDILEGKPVFEAWFRFRPDEAP